MDYFWHRIFSPGILRHLQVKNKKTLLEMEDQQNFNIPVCTCQSTEPCHLIDIPSDNPKETKNLNILLYFS
jgi:hypothetical protein